MNGLRVLWQRRRGTWTLAALALRVQEPAEAKLALEKERSTTTVQQLEINKLLAGVISRDQARVEAEARILIAQGVKQQGV